MSNFFPSTDDEPRPVGRYFKPRENGLYQLRILSPFLAYDMAWKDQRPVRRELDYEWAPTDYDAEGKFGPQPPKRCWAAAVWLHNFKPETTKGNFGLSQHVNSVQVWEITQASIRAALSKLGQDEDWGDPTKYDIKLTRENGKNDLPQYSIGTSLPKPLPEPAIVEWDAMCEFGGFDINRLLSGGDPFKQV